MLPTKGIESIFLHAHLRDPYYNNYAPSSSWYDTSINNRSFYSKPGQGYGQSRLLSNTAEPVRFNQMPYNRSSTYELRGIGSNLTLLTRSNLSFPIQPSPNEGRRSLFEPTVMANKTGQTSQVMGFGQHGLSAINGNSFNNNMMSSYGSLTANQPGMNSYGSSISNQPGMNSHGSSTPTQQGMMSYGSLTPSQPGLNSYGSVTHNARVNSYESLTPNQPGPSNFSYGMQLFLNNATTTYKPQPLTNAPTQSNLQIPQLENLDLYDYLGNTDELPSDISNFQFDHNKVYIITTLVFQLCRCTCIICCEAFFFNVTRAATRRSGFYHRI